MKYKVIILLLVIAISASIFFNIADGSEEREPKFITYRLSLEDGVDIDFKTDGLTKKSFARVEFWIDGVLSQTIEKLPKPAYGKHIFSCTELSLDDLDKKVTAKLYLKRSEEAIHVVEKSVKDYCRSVLRGSSYHENDKTVLVDLLNYSAAYQVYQGETDPAALVNADLTPEEQAYGTQQAPNLNSITSVGDQTGYAVQWHSFGLLVKDVDGVYFNLEAQSMEGLTLKVNVAGNSWDITEFTLDPKTGLYRINLDMLNPDQMREVITAQVFKRKKAVSSVLTTSVESYAANATNESVKAVAIEMIKYGDANKLRVR